MFRRNVASQFIGYTAINASTGATMTGTTGFAAYRVIDGGAQASAGGTVTDKGNGQYSFALAQADTNGNDISILFTMTGMVAVEKTFVTTACDPTVATNFGILALPATAATTNASLLTSGTGTDQISVSAGKLLLQATQSGVTIPTVTTVGTLTTYTGNTVQTGDSYARLGAPAGASHSADTAAVKNDTASIKTATNTGVAPGAAGGLFIAGTNAATVVTTSFTTTFTGNVTGSVGSVTGNVGGNVTGSVGSVTGLTTALIATAVNTDTTNVTTNGSPGKMAANFATATTNTAVFTTAALANGPSGGTAPTTGQITTAVVAGMATAPVGSVAAGVTLTDAGVDAIFTRDWTAITGEAARSMLNALRFLRNKFSMSGSTLIVTKEDDVTSAWTATITTDATALPITGSDPS